MIARVLGAGVATVAVTVAGLWLAAGVPVHWGVLVSLPIAAIAAGYVLSPRGAEPIWAPLPMDETAATSHQAATLASRLAEASVYPERFRTRVQPRLRRLAEARLRRAGVADLSDPRAVQLLGADLHRLVTDPDATLPDSTATAALCARLEEQ